MNKEINNHTLNKRIDSFKKRYNELLLELDNSSFLNLTKFSNSDWIEAKHSENIVNLLEENEQVNKNLEILKDSIREKIKNLELLSQKTNANTSEEDYIRTYEDLICEEKMEFNNFKNISFYRVYDDIDRTISKIDNIKEYIEEKVLTKLDESEREKLELTNILDALNKRIQQLISEKNHGDKVIDELKINNQQMQEEHDKSIASWMNLSTQLDNLNVLIDQNEEESKRISYEKDKLIEELEKKVNDLIFENAENKVFVETSTDDLIENIADIFVSALSKVVFELIKKFFFWENTYKAKQKYVNHNFDILFRRIKSIHRSNKMMNGETILDIEEYDNSFIDETNNEYLQSFLQIKTVEDIDVLFDENFIIKITYICNNLDKMIDDTIVIKESFEHKLSTKSIKKLNTVITEVHSYSEKMNLFAQQINNFLHKLIVYKQDVINTSILNEQYWANLSVFFDKVVFDLNKDFTLFESVRNLFMNQLLSRIDSLEVNDNSNNMVNFEYENQMPNILSSDELVQEYEYEEISKDKDDEIEFETYQEIEDEQNNIEKFNANEAIEKQEEFIENELNTIANEYLADYSIKQEENVVENLENDSNSDLELNDETIAFDIKNPDDSLQFSLLPEDENHNEIQENIETIVTPQEDKSLQENSSDNVMDDIKEYIEMCEISKEDNQKIMDVINSTSSSEEKMESIQVILTEILNKKNLEDRKKNYLITKKKYNKNLKLRLIKSKLFNIKLRLDISLDEKYLEIIENLKRYLWTTEN